MSSEMAWDFGTLVMHQASTIGSGLFKLHDRTSWDAPFIYCKDLTDQEKQLHTLLQKITTNLGIEANVSAFELPILLQAFGKRGLYNFIARDIAVHYVCQDEQITAFQDEKDSNVWGYNPDLGVLYYYCFDAWHAWMANQSLQHPCSTKIYSNRLCCPQASNPLTSASLTGVLKLMKFASRGFSNTYNSTILQKAISDKDGTLAGHAFKQDPFNVKERLKVNDETYANTCKFKTEEITWEGQTASFASFSYKPCMDLKPALTNSGICYGFNTPSHRELLASENDKYIKAFEAAFETENPNDGQLQMGFASRNTDSGFFAMFDKRLLGSVNHRDHHFDRPYTFQLGISDRLGSFDNRY